MNSKKTNDAFKHEVDMSSIQKQNSLYDFMDLNQEEIEQDEKDELEWRKLWVGMPEFVNEENSSYKKLFVHFRTKEDYDEFAKLINQNLSEKTKSIWYPKLDRDENTLKRWIEE